MFKRSNLNNKIKNAIIILNEETVSLGNSKNTSSIFRKHKFTVIRPNLMGNINSDDIPSKKEKISMGMSLLSNLKKKITSNKIDSKQFIDIKLIPNHVLVNPSQWGSIIKRNKDGSVNKIESSNDTLISLRNLIGYDDRSTISVNFKLKVNHVK